MATQDTVAAYMASWNEADETKRRKLLDAAWAVDATYTDSMSHAAGRNALVDLISQFQKQMAGSSIAQTSGIDEHHRIQSIVGFFGPPPVV